MLLLSRVDKSLFSPVHIPVGMFLARCVPGGEIPVFLASALSHLALDAIPHGDSGIGHWIHSAPDRKTKLSRLLPLSIADQIVALIVFLILLRSPAFLSVPLPLLLAGAIGSMAPDYLTGFRDLLPRPPTWVEKLHRLHERCHFHGRDPFSALTGLILQALLLLLVCVFAFGRV
ncbi:MAG: hypothetical protein ABR82_07395 [Verrucomicrobia subdivision 6 bacterium BACL9 MAG-120507-bin52]|uniref:Uncharacterized protein n=1 Tax=Verrucomicrobia subdivision 6 bacterium BACL9 MAG-120507-bin52 TaxID=1655590 RepID=A0A0R2RIK9_9BACT|nr:MAG: hypothetical protein ABR82_07395 [Verrucomicrobia subdivision 6 bacterium BACL9 MAG-120507-bin52]